MIMRGLTCNLDLFTTIYNDLAKLHANTLAISLPKQTSLLPHNCHVDVTSADDIESTFMAVGDVGAFVTLTEDICVVVGSSSSDRSPYTFTMETARVVMITTIRMIPRHLRTFLPDIRPLA
ncbi:hypothetical protein NP493_354g01031 [Ridgeia piscesae]|uniref:Uncharacterized protein n=1 Tax=Ridgeia piscesae TaxID=27915 RepID=A0AAD9L311_RIDPI|nr:hypothetical protein NP493_354g01031 [Ridgeia piscesae]